MKTQTRSILRGGNARVNFLLWLAPLAFFFAGAAAQTYTRQNTRVVTIHTETTFDSGGTATAVKVQAHLQTRLMVNDADATDKVGENYVRVVHFDLLAAPVASGSYTAAGKTVSGAQLAALLRQVALDEASRQGVQ